jgi:hypothetical protein
LIYVILVTWIAGRVRRLTIASAFDQRLLTSLSISQARLSGELQILLRRHHRHHHHHLLDVRVELGADPKSNDACQPLLKVAQESDARTPEY